MKKFLKQNKGIGGADALIAVVLIIMFAGLVATLSFNIYLSSTAIKRQSTATDYIVNIFEYIDKLYYDEVTTQNLKTYFESTENSKFFNTNKNQIKIFEGVNENPTFTIGENAVAYTISITIDKYSEQTDNQDLDLLDLVMQVTVNVNYKLNNKEQNIEMTKIKSRETLITPNKPQLNLIENTEKKNIYPIKYVNGNWEITEQSDKNWYNYFNGIWATVIKTENSDLQVGQTIEFLEDDEIYIWIPKYAYNDEKLEFLYKNTEKYVAKSEDEIYNKLIEIEATDEVPNDFANNNGIWINNLDIGENDIYTKLNEFYQRKNVINID